MIPLTRPTPQRALTPEQVRLGNQCRVHTGKVISMIVSNDIDGAMTYLSNVEQADGAQMVANVIDLMIVKGYALLPPEML